MTVSEFSGYMGAMWDDKKFLFLESKSFNLKMKLNKLKTKTKIESILLTKATTLTKSRYLKREKVKI